MLTLFLTIVFVILLTISKSTIKDRISRHVLLLYVTLWMVVMIVSSYNPYNLKDVSIRTYLVILLHLLFFITGFAVAIPNMPNVNRISKSLDLNKQLRSIIESRWLLITYIGMLIFAVILFYRQQTAILQYNLGYVRNDFYNLMFENDPFMAFIYNYCLAPFFYILIVFFGYMIVNYRKWWKIILFIPYILIYGSIAGGRVRFMAVVVIIIFLFIVSPLYLHNKSQRKKALRGVVFFSALMFLVMSIMSMFRAGESDLSSEGLSVGRDYLGKQLVVYSIGPLRALDYALDYDIKNRFGGYQLGEATFCGVEKFFEPLLRHGIGLRFESSYKTVVGYLQTNVIEIGNNLSQSFNFAYTGLIFHYIDFGIIGICLLPFIFAYIVRRCLLRLQYNQTIEMLVVNSVFFYTMIYYIFSFFFINCFAVEILLIMFVSEYIKGHSNKRA